LRQLEKKVLDFLADQALFAPAEKVLLAVSGGADSTALLHIIAALKKNSVLPVQIVCAHINHRLRGDEANRDENFVIEQCAKLHLPVITKKINVRKYAAKEKLSIETAARQLRINALLRIAKSRKCSCIATAHQKNDNAETIVHRLFRGTGFRGLCGIRPVVEFSKGVRFVRPLLCASRQEIVEYLRKRKIKWCEDRTNLDCYYRRNFIRNRLLPALQRDCKIDLVEQFARLAESARGFYRLVCAAADDLWPNAVNEQKRSIGMDLSILAEQSPEVRIEIVRRILFRLGVGEQDFTQKHYKNVLALSQNARLQLPGNVEVSRQGGIIIFSHRGLLRKRRVDNVPPKKLIVPGKTKFEGVLIETRIFNYDSANFKNFKSDKTNTVEWLDFDKLKLPLKIRFRKSGDRFCPLGMKAEKKVGKFLTDEKVAESLRQKLLVIEDTRQIIWLCPVRLSERVKITTKTKNILQLKVFTG
jgi:tRNA(Ile)-lysidine synthase